METHDIEYEVGSSNVFADLGLPDADGLLAKAQLAMEIANSVERRGLTQAQAAELLGVTQPKISALLHGNLRGFSLERLLRFVLALGSDVEIVIAPAEAKGHLRVSTSAA